MRLPSVNLIILFGFFMRAAVSAWNGFWGPSYGASADALTIHERAVGFAVNNLAVTDFNIGTDALCYFLGFFYYLISDSLFFGGLISSVIWVFSAIILTKIFKLLGGMKDGQKMAMLIYALLPSSFLLTGITLRESYQLLFVNLALFSAINIYLIKSLKYWFVFFGAVIGMGVLHASLFAFGVLAIIVTILFVTFGGAKKNSSLKFLAMLPICAAVLIVGSQLFISSVSYNLEDGLGSAVESYQTGGLTEEDARAAYKDDVAISGPYGLLMFIPVSLFQYLFEPMPWRMTSIVDIEVVAENILRLFLIYKMYLNWRESVGGGRKVILLIILLYFMTEAIWSLGTINWGTAIRHHIPALGLLLAGAFAGEKIKNNGQHPVVRNTIS